MPCLQGLLCKMGITVLSPCSLLLQVVGGSWDTPTKSHQKYPRGLVLHGLTGQEPATQVSILSTGRNRERANWDLLSYCSSLLFHFRSIDIIARDERYTYQRLTYILASAIGSDSAVFIVLVLVYICVTANLWLRSCTCMFCFTVFFFLKSHQVEASCRQRTCLIHTCFSAPGSGAWAPAATRAGPAERTEKP